MADQEMRLEIERLRHELASSNVSRERLREIICAVMHVEPPEVMEKQIDAMMKRPVQGINGVIEELLRDQAEMSPKGQQISA